MENQESPMKCNDCITCNNIKNSFTHEIELCSSENESDVENSANHSEIDTTSDNNKDNNYANESFEDDTDDEVSLDMNFVLHDLQNNACQRQIQANKTFSSQQLRDIERTNGILMNKILSNNRRVNQYKIAPKTTKLNTVSSAAVNRKRNQEKIARDNQILLKKIQSVRPSVMYK